MEMNPFDDVQSLLDRQCAVFDKIAMAFISVSGIAVMSVIAAFATGLIHPN